MRNRRKYQEQLFDNDPVYSHQHAAAVVGEFYEHLTAKLFNGVRLQVDDPKGYNPDIETRRGAAIEAKASARSRWLIGAEQLEYLEQRPGSFFVFWRYPYSDESLISRFTTKLTIFQYLASSTIEAFAVSSGYLRALTDEKTVRGLDHGTYWQINHKTLRSVRDGERTVLSRMAPPPRVTSTITRRLRVLGVIAKSTTLTTIDNRERPTDVVPPF